MRRGRRRAENHANWHELGVNATDVDASDVNWARVRFERRVVLPVVDLAGEVKISFMERGAVLGVRDGALGVVTAPLTRFMADLRLGYRSGLGCV